jgi:O-antigen ligase
MNISSEFISQIFLTPAQMGLMLAIFGFIVWIGRPEWALGMYFSTALWTRVVMFGPTASSYVFLSVIVAAATVYMLRHRRMSLLPSLLRPAARPWLPPHDRWILVWMLLWVIWMLLLLNLFKPERGFTLIRILVFYILPGLPMMLLFASDIRRLRGFAVAYLLMTMVGGWFMISLLGIPLDYLLVDPTLKGTNVIRLNITNYHFPAYAFSIALIMTIGLFLESKRWYAGLFYLAGAAYCVYFLLLCGSRQSMNGSLIAAVAFGLWAMRRAGPVKARAILVLTLLLSVGTTLYLTSPELIIRKEDGEQQLGSTVSLVDDRGAIWAQGWEYFLSSPLWGNGFEFNSHNIFIGTLADQGIVGAIFFSGFLIFAVSQSRRAWLGDQSDPGAVWRMAFLGILIFSVVHSQASGNTFTVWHLYWAAAAQWWLRALADEPATARQAPAIRLPQPPLRPALRGTRAPFGQHPVRHGGEAPGKVTL